MAKRLRAASRRSPDGRQIAQRCRRSRRPERRDRPRRAAARRIEAQRGVGRVVARQHARRGDRGVGLRQSRPARPSSRLDLLARQGPGPQLHRRRRRRPRGSSTRRPPLHGPPSSTGTGRQSRRAPARRWSATACPRDWRRARRAAGPRPRSAPAPADGRGCGSPTVSSPAVTRSERPAPGRCRQHQRQRRRARSAASRRASGENSASVSAIARSAQWTISGLKRGRPLVS